MRALSCQCVWLVSKPAADLIIFAVIVVGVVIGIDLGQIQARKLRTIQAQVREY